MTKEETNRILTIIYETYPLFRKDRDPQFTSEIWHAVFRNAPYELVSQALMEFIATDTKGFHPVPGALRAIILRRMQQEELPDAEAWRLTRKAISASLYYSREEFDRLPQAVRDIVRNPATLREWAAMDDWQIRNSIEPWFFRAYNSSMDRERNERLLPGGDWFCLPGAEHVS